VLKFAAAGAVIGSLAGLIMFGGKGANGADAGASLAIIMVPTFALIGAVLGALNGLLFSVIGVFKR